MSDQINLFLSCDDNYAAYCGITIQSALLACSTPSKVRIFLVDNQIEDTNKTKLKDICNSRGATIVFLEPDTTSFKDIPAFRYGIAAYQRLAMSKILPSDVEKVIYLDSDILVLGDISRLWQTNMENFPLAAVENFSPKAHQSLGFERQKYFNSGVLLIDVHYWKNHDLGNQALHFINQKKSTIKYVDQCALNFLYQNNWKKLPPEWNVQGDIFRVIKKYLTGSGYNKSQLTQAACSPKIVHFIGEQKPWMWTCFSPYLSLYEKVKITTPWKSDLKRDDSFLAKFKHYISAKKLITQYQRKHKLKRYGS